MSETHRTDGNHERGKGPHEATLRMASLDRGRLIQTHALNFRNMVAYALRSQTPEQVAQSMSPHGDPTYHEEIIEAALFLEYTRPGEDQAVGNVVDALTLMQRNAGVGPEHSTSIPEMAARLNAGGTTRLDDTDIKPNDWETLVAGVPAPLREIIMRQRDSTLAMQYVMDHHDKFDAMLNGKAFERDLNASKKPGTFIFFDLINFKNYNSRYSYDFVDEVILKTLCKRMKQALPPSALLSIKGGDEFMVFIPDDVTDGQMDTRVVASVIATIVQDAMVSVTAEDVQAAKPLLVGRKTQTPGTVARFVYGWMTGGEDDAAKQAREKNETERILADIRQVHGKISAVKRTPDMRCAEAVHATEAGLKKVSSWHYRANMRFPSSVVEEGGQLSPPFSATGSEVRSFFVGARNDLLDLIRRLTR